MTKDDKMMQNDEKMENTLMLPNNEDEKND